MNKFDEIYNKIISEANSEDNNFKWIYRAEDKTGKQIGEDNESSKELINTLDSNTINDKIYIYEIAFDENGNQKRKHKYSILVPEGNGWKTIWSKMERDLALDRRFHERKDNMHIYYKKWEPNATGIKSWWNPNGNKDN